ncbi:hypothetical protein GO495_05530 [Chitinophaga oryziterrae]|uniref:Uncharacterized protein n=1 Tax=Chitinophaga oryziterrae TaxID=1031224 RepID=A0A6N8J540_9BACT|nr:hypothetical protein [Chitinophaga oryziterrae]MVT40034.1 hypothetical protein [Chitinophaga oryziterrae]
MLNHDTQEKLENIIRGIVVEGAEDHCTATRNFLCEGYSTSSTVKKDFDRQSIIKKEKAESLKLYSTNNNLWLKNLPDHSEMIAKGGEAQIYLDSDNRSVLKLNDAVYSLV